MKRFKVTLKRVTTIELYANAQSAAKLRASLAEDDPLDLQQEGDIAFDELKVSKIEPVQ